MPGRPSAGGKAPLWQVAHCAVTLTWVWFQRVGFHPVVAWQLAQLVAPTGMWLPGLPVAVLPLWQLAHWVAEVKALWSTLPPVHEVKDLWQLSHCAVVARWLADLPSAGGKDPLWQLAHWPTTGAWVWFQVLGFQVLVL